MLIVDAHLDLSYNALRGRDWLRPAAEQLADDEGTPAVGLPDLLAGGVGLICATIFLEPAVRSARGYRSADEAALQARGHLAWYQAQVGTGRLAWVRQAGDLPALPGTGTPAGPPQFILLMEGADALRTPEDVAWWWSQGLRIVGLAWKRTGLAGGTGDPGPLTALGRHIVQALDTVGMIHDVSHLAEQSFWDLLDLARGPVMASHSNARAIIPTDRHLSDAMARVLAAREGVIGINLYDRFLVPPAETGRRATLADVLRQVLYFAELLGDTRCVGLGTDLDGGFGRENIPQELRSAADLPRLADALAAAGLGDDQVRGIMGGNWLRFFQRALPV
jgi:membrane dipeptidase